MNAPGVIYWTRLIVLIVIFFVAVFDGKFELLLLFYVGIILIAGLRELSEKRATP